MNGAMIVVDFGSECRMLAAYFPQGKAKVPFFRFCTGEAQAAHNIPFVLPPVTSPIWNRRGPPARAHLGVRPEPSAKIGVGLETAVIHRNSVTKTSAENVKPISAIGAAGLSLAALGVVFGDIGTSPLYTLKTVLNLTGANPDASTTLGALSNANSASLFPTHVVGCWRHHFLHQRCALATTAGVKAVSDFDAGLTSGYLDKAEALLELAFEFAEERHRNDQQQIADLLVTRLLPHRL
jgi:hypothetical protein